MKILKELLIRFARYANTLTPYKLDEPLDPMVEDSIDDMAVLLSKYSNEQAKKVDRFEVIDDTGRAYVKGNIYGSPVSIELSYQDDGKTLKVFVSERKPVDNLTPIP